MDSTVYESKKKFSYQASEANEFAMVFYHCIAAMYESKDVVNTL